MFGGVLKFGYNRSKFTALSQEDLKKKNVSWLMDGSIVSFVNLKSFGERILRVKNSRADHSAISHIDVVHIEE